MNNRIYLDNNATTKVDPEVFAAMKPFFVEKYGNPNSLHTFGTEVHEAMNKALDQMYRALGASDDDDVYVTSCSTESNNTVLKSIFFQEVLPKHKTQIVISGVEHPTVAKTCAFLSECGADITVVKPNAEGIVTPEMLEQAMDKNGNCALVSVMLANNETGVVMPIKALCTVAHRYGAIFHTDATQGFGKIPIDVGELGVDLLSTSAHKFHGPKGVGALFVKKGVDFVPLFHGGEQMHGKRAGTINVPFMVGMGKAMEMACDFMRDHGDYIRRLRDKLEDALIAAFPCFTPSVARERRLPNTIFGVIPGVDGKALREAVNKEGVAISTGSACEEEGKSTCVSGLSPVRISLSRFTTEEEVDRAIEIIVRNATLLQKLNG